MHYIVAGTGYTGRRVLEALPPGRSFGLNRSPLTDSGFDIRRVDFDRPNLALPIPGDASPCTLLYTVPPPRDGADDPRLARFLAALTPLPARLVYLSTSGVYGDRGGELVTENDPVNPRTDRAKRRVAAESTLSDACNEAGCERVILRVPGIYGPGRLGVSRLSADTTVLREADSGPGNRIHVADLVACCLAAMKAETPPGIYNVGDGDHRSSSRFLCDVARLANRPAPRAISLDDAKRLWSDARLSFADESRTVDLTRMREVLKVTPRYANPEDGIRASLRDTEVD